MAKHVKKVASAKKAVKGVAGANTKAQKAAPTALVQTQAKRGSTKKPAKKALSTKTLRGPGPVAAPTRGARSTVSAASIGSQERARATDHRPLPEAVDEETIARLISEAEGGIPAENLRRRGRPAIGDEAASTYSVRLPDDLVSLVDGRSEIDGVTRGETIRRALIGYLTK